MMKRVSLVVLATAVGIGLAGLAVAQKKEKDAASGEKSSSLPADFRRDVQQQVVQLGAGSYKSRESAEAALIAYHRDYMQLLRRQAAAVEGIEQRKRLEQVVETIRAGMNADFFLENLSVDYVGKCQKFLDAHPKELRALFGGTMDEQLAAIRRLDRSGPSAEPMVLAYLTTGSKEAGKAALFAAKDGPFKSDAMVDALVRFILQQNEQEEMPGRLFVSMGGNTSETYMAFEALERINNTYALAGMLHLLSKGKLSDFDTLSHVGALVVKFNDKRAIPYLLPLLERTEVRINYGDPENDKEKCVGMADSDVALHALLTLTGQKISDYQMDEVAGCWGQEKSPGFETEKKRAEAVKKFRAWWEEHKDKPPYKDLKPLEFPKQN